MLLGVWGQGPHISWGFPPQLRSPGGYGAEPRIEVYRGGAGGGSPRWALWQGNCQRALLKYRGAYAPLL